MIISASRRTDIPAFYSEWFINRIKSGFLLVKNPFNAHQVKRVSLLSKDVDVIVFWTRNPKKLIPHLDLLDQLGYRYYFQYTITGYNKKLETNTLHPVKSVEVFKDLSRKIGKEKVIWRYDPIILSNMTPVSEHLRLFEKLAAMLSGYTDRVVISFADLYKKTEMNLNKVDGLEYEDILQYEDELNNLCSKLKKIANKYGMSISTCAEEVNLESAGIKHGKCIDDGLIEELFNIKVTNIKDQGQRLECGCVKSVDIGVYNSCLHGCTYCYATYQKNGALNNYKKHDPNSPFLIGSGEGYEHFMEQIPIQNSLL
ncbi:TPA: DUF1848 family protein [Vibrio vulnificus]|uniref:DUF1848 domain-containing protein n=1 Tax=Vibrio vulnificus TaxID=672 RepID=UPI001A279EC9|nr:DUF1848 domain-containing protein [Vibrio vulnificus]WIL72866.1 DUF1848 domain-containing protein [Vibrio vulnificus]HAS6046043.1 DUF1848 family protein [Vibrio vulnificus]HAT8507053.1 DUF1848 family protein [Vibrio vulnificus]